jgi:hypothetical protein
MQEGSRQAANAFWRQIRRHGIWLGCTFRARKKRTRFCLRASEHYQRRHTCGSKGDTGTQKALKKTGRKGNASESRQCTEVRGQGAECGGKLYELCMNRREKEGTGARCMKGET